MFFFSPHKRTHHISLENHQRSPDEFTPSLLKVILCIWTNTFQATEKYLSKVSVINELLGKGTPSDGSTCHEYIY